MSRAKPEDRRRAHRRAFVGGHVRRGPTEAMVLRIRPAARDDLDAVSDCRRGAVRPGEDAGFGRPVGEQLFYDADRLRGAWDSGRVTPTSLFVAEVGGRVVAYVTVEPRGADLELDTIDVVREFQGRGIGSRLVAHVESLARRTGKRSVTTGTSRNAAGVPWKSFRWWLRRGYRVTGEERNSWTERFGGSEIRMTKGLESPRRRRSRVGGSARPT
jgi:GNAT superfamily N-acetyltransferase